LEVQTERREAELIEIVRSMTDTLVHRGPDAGGVWVNADERVALGHRRLSILDLSEAGAQPMHSESGRFVISYNGEIYNFAELRADLEKAGHRFRGHSDTEVLVTAVEDWGLEKTLARINGMFAFGLWDRKERVLSLVRDRAGKKPLYYGWFGNSFGFASELKALRRHPGFDDAIDLDALGDFVVYGWVPQPRSIYGCVRKLPPGSYVQIRLSDEPWAVEPETYWSAEEVAEAADRSEFTGSYDGAVTHLDSLLQQAVSERMVADVDLGALLSGGIDSTAVVALMQAVSDRPVKTFTIGFWEPKYNEAEHAAAVARHLGTEHRELYVTPEQALDVIDQLPAIYDEPFADASQIPTYLVCKLAREDVTVVLSGDGGDELFAGYKRYLRCLDTWRKLGRVPHALREPISAYQRSVRQAAWKWLSPSDPISTHRLNPLSKPFSKIGRRWCSWKAVDLRELQASDFRKCLSGSDFVPQAKPARTPLIDPTAWADVGNPLRAMRHYDYVGYLPDDILVKVDRASMAVSLEARAPLLDVRVLDFAWSLPDDYVVRDGAGKRVLKDVVYRHVPRELIDRPKRGFGVPVKDWLRGQLKPWAEELLSETLLRSQGIFDVDHVRRAWAQHQCGWDNHAEMLWALLMFQAWWKARQ
jgi:asparagine synthase (glutamine-hydrolysing)